MDSVVCVKKREKTYLFTSTYKEVLLYGSTSVSTRFRKKRKTSLILTTYITITDNDIHNSPGNNNNDNRDSVNNGIKSDSITLRNPRLNRGL